MNATQAENLRALIVHMGALDHALDMSLYHRCGTPACAMGEAATVKAIADQGLGLEGKLSLTLGGKCCGHIEPAEKLFGLDYDTAQRLFGEADFNKFGTNRVTPQEWALEARKVLSENGYSMDEAKPAQTFQEFMAQVTAPLKSPQAFEQALPPVRIS